MHCLHYFSGFAWSDGWCFDLFFVVLVLPERPKPFAFLWWLFAYLIFPPVGAEVTIRDVL